MTAASTTPTETVASTERGRGSRRWSDPAVIVVFLLVVAAAISIIPSRRSPAPSATAAEVGFARDMAVHHAQAVEIAELERVRTLNDQLSVLTRDIALTQQAQIGQMRGWLDAWGFAPYGTEPPMAWMGHGTTAAMPGMASRTEIDALKAATGSAADELFLRLMIRHHRGGILMAAAAAELATRPEVRSLAIAIRDGQHAEITAMQDSLAQLGAAPENTVVTMADSVRPAPTTDASPLADAARGLLVVAAALGLTWLLIDHARRRWVLRSEEAT